MGEAMAQGLRRRPTWVEFFVVLGLTWAGTRHRRCNGLLFWASLTNGPLLYGDSGFTTASCLQAPALHSNPFRMFPHSQLQVLCLRILSNSTFQHPALVCIAGHTPPKAGVGRAESVPCVQVSLILCHTLVAMFSSHRE